MAWHMWRTVAPNFDDFSKRRVYQLGRRLASGVQLIDRSALLDFANETHVDETLGGGLGGRIALHRLVCLSS